VARAAGTDPAPAAVDILHALMDHVDISTSERGTTVTMTKEL
jgi:hypothetical protein